ncbi:MAG: rRNA maturation RNase YbeY [Planctomycetota bacterium]|nr:rRNA maturation RNase YbeY [Planctomycetota bacterium]
MDGSSIEVCTAPDAGADALACEMALTQLIVGATTFLPSPPARCSIRVVGDTEMIRLHTQHLSLESKTDVLTFHDSAAGAPVEVDIAICADEARRRCEEGGQLLIHELLLYAVHGLLHCYGFDDHSDADAARMHVEEDRILVALGVGAIYSREDAQREAS